MNRRNFFKLAASLALTRLLPAKLHSGGIVPRRIISARDKFNNLNSFKSMPCMISVHETVFTPEQMNLIEKVAKANASKIRKALA